MIVTNQGQIVSAQLLDRTLDINFFFAVIVCNVIMFNIVKNRRAAPTQLKQLVMGFVWIHPDSTAELCR